jgi:hypothetical protein
MERSHQDGLRTKSRAGKVRAYRPPQLVGALGLCLLTVPLLGLHRFHPASLPAGTMRSMRPAPSSPSDSARQIARWCLLRAERAVNSEREVLEAWDPAATESLNQEVWRRQLMTADRNGELKRALKWGRHAAALARTPEEAYAAARLLTRLECEAGHPEAELEQARKLAALQPDSEYALVLLQRAAVCNHQESLARKTAAALRKRGYLGTMEKARSCHE